MFSGKDYYDVLNSFNLKNVKGVVIDDRFDDLDEEKRETFMNNLKQCENLTYLKIDCEEIEYIPGNLNNLEDLIIEKGPKIKEIPKNLPKLRYLSIFFDMMKIMNEEENDLKEIPESLTNLKVLDLYYTLNKIKIPNTVENLKLDNCPNIEIDNLTNLKILNINNPDLVNLPDTLINLNYLYVDMCSNLKDIPETLINLKELHIRGCGNITIPNNIRNLPNIVIEQI